VRFLPFADAGSLGLKEKCHFFVKVSTLSLLHGCSLATIFIALPIVQKAVEHLRKMIPHGQKKGFTED
jgi:hypothetical protein